MWIKLITLIVIKYFFFCSCRSLVDTIYSLKDEVQELKQVSAPIDECHWCRKIRCFQQNTRLGILAVHASPPPHCSRTTSAWGGLWKRSNERGKSWNGSLGGCWRTWTTPAGMRPTSEISIYLRVVNKTVRGQVVKSLWTKVGHQQRLIVIL